MTRRALGALPLPYGEGAPSSLPFVTTKLLNRGTGRQTRVFPGEVKSASDGVLGR